MLQIELMKRMRKGGVVCGVEPPERALSRA